MKLKHTPAPWYKKSYAISGYLIMANNSSVCAVHAYRPVEEMTANSNLICQSPELLQDDIEWVAIHRELLKHDIKIPKHLSDRIFSQLIKSEETIKKATE